ncbi:MAG: AAA family ATPase [Planctomycetaceae bacterium]|nr:AAA family ATPase [Planctomycetaceae bacterium]
MNIIAAPKVGKSWLVIDLALAIASNQLWLGMFETIGGPVLILDNELHAETVASRIPKVAAARGLDLNTVAETVFVQTLRGKLQDIKALGNYFRTFPAGKFKVIIIDAFYRALPPGIDENDNAAMAAVYNTIDDYADHLGCSFILIHHASNGNQANKAVTDIGSGAGSQSRATDTHLVLRPHKEDGCVVLEAAVRSWPSVDSRCLRWNFPIFIPQGPIDACDKLV